MLIFLLDCHLHFITLVKSAYLELLSRERLLTQLLLLLLMLLWARTGLRRTTSRWRRVSLETPKSDSSSFLPFEFFQNNQKLWFTSSFRFDWSLPASALTCSKGFLMLERRLQITNASSTRSSSINKEIYFILGMHTKNVSTQRLRILRCLNTSDIFLISPW